ncbi:MAG: aldehyde dehydrogenase family protein [Nitrososphaerales archaeon]
MKNKLELESFFDPLYTTAPDGIPVFKMLVNGRWIPASMGKTFDVKTPIDESVIARAQMASVKDVKKAVDSAYKNKSKIREIPGIGRIEIFRKAAEIMAEHREALVRTIMLEAGKPEEDGEGEVQATIDRMELTMEEARRIFGEYLPGDWSEDTTQRMALVIRQPIGVVVAISPFNYPLFIAAAKIIPALLAGNTVVAKSASADPLVLLLYARVLEAAGLPKGVLNVITGSGSDVGKALVSDDKVGAVNFTGSTEVGRFVTKHAGIKKLHLELGGKGMAIVLDDADLDLAASKCVAGSLKNAGQRCDAISAVLVMEKVADEFVKKVEEQMDKWKHGDPKSPSVKVGPVIAQRAAERIHILVQDAVEKGADLRRGGKHRGCYYKPTLLDKVPLTCRISREETFGPVVTVIRIKSEDDAIEIGSRSRYGLDSCVFTENFYRMWKIAKRLKVGEITINDLPRHGVGFFPFGGSKESGIGREGIGYSIDEMTYLKTIVFNLEPAGLGKVKHRYGL